MKKNSNGTLIVIIIVLSLFVIFLTAGLCYVLRGSSGRFNLNDVVTSIDTKAMDEIVLEEEFNLSDVKNILITNDAGDIEVLNSEEADKVKVTAYGWEKTDKVEAYINENLELVIKVDEKSTINFIPWLIRKHGIKVEMPKEFNGEIKVHTDAGNIKIEKFENASANVEANAGNIDIKKMESCIAKVDAGDIKLGEVSSVDIDCECGNVNIKLVSNSCKIDSEFGNIKIENLDIKKSSIITSECGNIKIDKTSDIEIVVKSELGSVDVKDDNTSSDIILDIQSELGNITIK